MLYLHIGLRGFRFGSSPEVNATAQQRVQHHAPERGSQQQTLQHEVSIVSSSPVASCFEGQHMPFPLFDSRAAAASAASCCTNAATADAASPTRWARKIMVSSSGKGRNGIDNIQRRSGSLVQREKSSGALRANSEIEALSQWQEDASSSTANTAAAQATQRSKNHEATKAIGCTASPRAIDTFAKQSQCSSTSAPRSRMYPSARRHEQANSCDTSTEGHPCANHGIQSSEFQEDNVVSAQASGTSGSTEPPVRGRNTFVGFRCI